jgi:hypothetical protein
MRARDVSTYLVSFALLVLLAAGYAWHNSRDEADAMSLSSSIDDSSPQSGSASRRIPASGPRLALPLVGLPPVAPERESATGGRRVVPEEGARQGGGLAAGIAAAREERILMARTWGMSEEQYRKFEAAATSEPHLRRKVVYERFFRGDLDRESFDEELEKADARDNEELRELLGQHYFEYTLMRGHFAEAGLDQKPFEPPTYDPH